MTTEYLEFKLSRRPHSPLFARLANEYLAAGRIDDAKELCTAGIDRYPQYTTAHLILAKCFASEQDYASALFSLEQAQALFPDAPLPRELYAQWESILTVSQSSPAQSVTEIVVTEEIAPTEIMTPDVAVEFISEEDEPQVVDQTEQVEPTFEPPVQSFTESAIETIEQSEEAPNENIQTLTEEILPPQQDFIKADTESSEIEPNEPSPFSLVSEPVMVPDVVASLQEEPPLQIVPEITSTFISDEGRIVSKTLAEIYAMQKEYGEAIITYRLLRQQKPERSAEINPRIAELEKLQAEKIRE